LTVRGRGMHRAVIPGVLALAGYSCGRRNPRPQPWPARLYGVDVPGGRVTVGAGFGWNTDELADHGVPAEKRRTVLREYI
jgi:hypothetical protein